MMGKEMAKTLHAKERNPAGARAPRARQVYVDGELYDKDKAVVSIFDHGLLYGDGVFEGIRAYDGLIFKLREHLDRLYETAHTLMLKVPLGAQEMERDIVRTLQANKLKDAYIRVVVTRGVGDLGLDPRKCPKATVIIITDAITLYPTELYRRGLEIVTVPTPRNLPEALNPQLKSLNYLNNILAKIEANQAGVEEALMLNHQGYVAECTGDNIFMAKEGSLTTPPVYLGILNGITRRTILEIAKKIGIPAEEAVMTRHDLYNADEVFLTGTAAEVIPVVKMDGRVIAQGKPGSMTRRLMEEFRRRTRTDGVRYPI